MRPQLLFQILFVFLVYMCNNIIFDWTAKLSQVIYTVKNIFKICYHNIFSFVKSTL